MSSQSAHTLDLNILLETDKTGKETAIVLEIPDCRIIADNCFFANATTCKPPSVDEICWYV
jgi:hypothetical protein